MSLEEINNIIHDFWSKFQDNVHLFYMKISKNAKESFFISNISNNKSYEPIKINNV